MVKRGLIALEARSPCDYVLLTTCQTQLLSLPVTSIISSDNRRDSHQQNLLDAKPR